MVFMLSTNHMPEYKKITRSIEVTVMPVYIDDESSPSDSHYVWAYHVRIANKGENIVQLISRHWRITDGNGITQEVRGPGVVGQQPTLKPGATYEYTSGVPLSTPTGIMSGRYEMMNQDGEFFDVEIPAFSLDSDEQIRKPN